MQTTSGFFTTSSTSVPIFSFGLFADAHYAPGVHGSRYYQDSLHKLEACVETFNARRLPLAFNLGDLVDTAGSKEADLQLLDEICRVFARFRGERRSLLGNHDLVTMTKAEFIRAIRRSGCDQPYPGEDIPQPCHCEGTSQSCHCERSAAIPTYHTRDPISAVEIASGKERPRNDSPEESPPPTYGSFDRSGLHFILLDGNFNPDGSAFGNGNFHWADAWVSEEQIRWLAGDLRAAAGRPAIVLCHENLDHRLEEGELDPHIARNAAAVRRVLQAAGNVWAVVQGHDHPGFYTHLDGIPYIGLKAMVVGEGLENNAYAILSVYGDGGLVLEGFGRQESRCLEPRARPSRPSR